MTLTPPPQLRDWQRSHVGPDGQPLKDDGDFGPKTQWAFALEALPITRRLIVLGALRWVGLRETGVNRGSEIDAWLRACGVAVPKDPHEPAPNNAWCAAFVSGVLRAAGIACAEARVARLAKKYEPTTVVLPGDISYWVRPDGTGHCGIVTGVGPERVSACEGNSGDGVRVGWRASSQLRFSRPLAQQVTEGQAIPGPWEGLLPLGSQTR